MSRARKICRRLVGRLYGAYVLPRIARPSEATLDGNRLLTDPQVFHPIYFHSTRILIDGLRALDLGGKRFLDMGTGSGSVGIFAAKRGARVTACDINPRAVTVAAENARRSGVSIEVVESNVFSALGERTFDVISFNIPFYPREPRTHFEAAFFAGSDFQTVRAFAAGCTRALAPGGMVVVVFSEDSGRDRILSIFAEAGLAATAERITQKLFEQFYVVRLVPAKQAM